MSDQLIAASDSGFGISRQQFLMKAIVVAQKIGLKTPFKNGTAGKDWFAGFRKRNPDIVIRNPMKIGTNRAKSMSREIVSKFFATLKDLEFKVDNCPEKIWNIDETSFQLEQKLISAPTKKGAKVVPGRVSCNRDNITVVACGSAGGKLLPPLIIIKGKTHRAIYAYDTSQSQTGAAWTEDVLGSLWFKKIFLPNCGPSRPQLLIMDGHHLHEATEMLETGRQENIIILTIPPLNKPLAATH